MCQEIVFVSQNNSNALCNEDINYKYVWRVLQGVSKINVAPIQNLDHQEKYRHMHANNIPQKIMKGVDDRRPRYMHIMQLSFLQCLRTLLSHFHEITTEAFSLLWV